MVSAGRGLRPAAFISLEEGGAGEAKEAGIQLMIGRLENVAGPWVLSLVVHTYGGDYGRGIVSPNVESGKEKGGVVVDLPLKGMMEGEL